MAPVVVIPDVDHTITDLRDAAALFQEVATAYVTAAKKMEDNQQGSGNERTR